MHISRENYVRQALDEAQRTKSKKSSSTVAAQAATEWDILHTDWLNSLPAHPRMAEWVRRDWLSPDERALRVDEAGRWLDYHPERDGPVEDLMARIEDDLAEMDRAVQAKREAEDVEATRLEQAQAQAAEDRAQARATLAASIPTEGQARPTTVAGTMARLEALEATVRAIADHLGVR